MMSGSGINPRLMERKTMQKYLIENFVSGVVLGEYEGITPAAALDAMAREAGYQDHADALAVIGGDSSDLVVTEVNA